ncbi:hypothetical protein [Nocardioides sp. CER19]|uniref:DUF7144 family membrane protein n=1 Tax=Nocardioides sp. CER19 TaxID=3038538 RepID=UPI00244C3737|nr:hypothetical protein [Nocardioides sp. CER19]MDH2415559.1 hypothetical protein [Nocardioides sp. CER19]
MTAHTSPAAYDGSTAPTFAYGLTLFAGITLATVSVFQILNGIAALAKDTIFVRGINYAYEIDLTTWGWVHLVLGLIALGTGVGLVMAQGWAYVVGIIIAVISAVANFAFIPQYPLWSIIIITFNGFVIWALCATMSSDRRA